VGVAAEESRRGPVALDLAAMHRDPGRLAARRALIAGWYGDAFFADTSIAEQARRAAMGHAHTRLVFPSPERPAELDLAGLWAQASRLASAFAACGVHRGDVVAVQLPNWAEAAISYIASSILGAVVVPIVHSYGPRDTDWILDRVRPRVYLLPKGSVVPTTPPDSATCPQPARSRP